MSYIRSISLGAWDLTYCKNQEALAARERLAAQGARNATAGQTDAQLRADLASIAAKLERSADQREQFIRQNCSPPPPAWFAQPSGFAPYPSSPPPRKPSAIDEEPIYIGGPKDLPRKIPWSPPRFHRIPTAAERTQRGGYSFPGMEGF